MNKCTCLENACSSTRTVLSGWRHWSPAASSESLISLTVMHYYYFCLLPLFSIQITSAVLNFAWTSLSLHQCAHQVCLNNESESQFEGTCVSKSSSVKFSSVSASYAFVDASSSFAVPLKDIQMCSPDCYLSPVLWISRQQLREFGRHSFRKGDWYYLKYFKSRHILASVSTGTFHFTG